jgi:hypothetical protein
MAERFECHGAGLVTGGSDESGTRFAGCHGGVVGGTGVLGGTGQPASWSWADGAGGAVVVVVDVVVVVVAAVVGGGVVGGKVVVLAVVVGRWTERDA